MNKLYRVWIQHQTIKLEEVLGWVIKIACFIAMIESRSAWYDVGQCDNPLSLLEWRERVLDAGKRSTTRTSWPQLLGTYDLQVDKSEVPYL